MPLVPMSTYTIACAVAKKGVVSMCSPAAYTFWYFSHLPALRGLTLAPGWTLKGKCKARADAGYEFKGYGRSEIRLP